MSIYNYLWNLYFTLDRKVKNMIKWKDIPNYVGSYQISNYGQVRSIPRNVQYKKSYRHIAGKLLKIYVRKGFAYVCLCKHGVVKRVGIQELMQAVW